MENSLFQILMFIPGFMIPENDMSKINVVKKICQISVIEM